jgi:uncharacterized repeat protein (TIGR01451 family)
MSIWSHRSVAALIAITLVMLMAGLLYTPLKAQDAGAPVTVTITGSGRVESGVGWSDPILCPGDCTGATRGGGFAQLFAIPNNGWSAVGWGGLCAGQPRRDLCVVNFFGGGSVSMTFETPVPEIDVRGGPAVLLAANGNTTPDPHNGTDFGLANVSGSTIEHTFSIWNTGTGPLTLNGTPLVSLSGPNAADFTLLSPPAATVASDSNATFVLRFDPSAVGERSATVTIANNDSDEAPYSFSIKGTGYDAITSGPSPINYSESINGDLKSDTVYVPCSVSGFADEFILGVGVNRWTGTNGVTGNGVNQNDMFRALLPAGAYIDRITYQRESGGGSYMFSLTDAASQTLIQTGGVGALYAYNPPSLNSILTFMVISDFNPQPSKWTVTVNVIGSVQGSTGPILTFESASPAQVNLVEGQLGTACGRFSDQERDAVTILPGPLTTNPVLVETGPTQTFGNAPANSFGRWDWSVTSVDGPSNTQEVVLRARDNNPAGSSTSQLSFQLNVANVAPTVNRPTVAPDPSNEVATVTAQATWSDPGVLDVATCTVDYGDGSGALVGVANFNNGNGLCAGPSHTYADSGTYLISVVVTDKDGGVGRNSYSYVVSNLPPVIGSVTNNGPVKENRSVSITANAADPAGTADPLTYAFDCDNNFVYEIGPQPQSSASCAFSTFGTHSVNVQVRDDDGGLSTGSTLVTIVRNSPPVANNQNVTLNEDTSVGITLTASDVNGDSHTFSIVKAPDHGSVTGTPPAVTYKPTANYRGPDSFTFKANDGEADSLVATISITVNGVNDAPVANDDSFNTAEDTPLSASVAGNDNDVDGHTITYFLQGNVAHGALTFKSDGSFTYTPAANYRGADSFTYQANDGLGGVDTATGNITISAVNDAPNVTDDAATTVEDAAVTVMVLTNDRDSADGGSLNPASLSVISGPTSGTTGVNVVNGTIIYTPAANFYGSDSFTYRVCDNGTPLPALCGSATVILTVAAGTDNDDDNDGDGVEDVNDAFPLDPNESVDTDGDGTGDNADTDDDGDGTPDTADAFPLDAAESTDTDNDGIGNNADSDDDNDGVADEEDDLPLTPDESVDTDQDGTGNNADSDDDNDGVADSDDAFPLDPDESVDTDGDGIGNNADTDDDNDGVDDAQPDKCPLVSNPDQANKDGDTFSDACDDAHAVIGDVVWFDQDNNGIQGPDEPGISGVRIELYKVADAQIASADGTLVATTTTNSAGDYRFTNLESGDYYLVFTPPAGLGFTQHDVNDNSQENVDSDPVVPLVSLSVSTSDLQAAAEFDSDLAYTIHYTNSDPSSVATNIVITAAIPAGTSFVAASSDPAWSCTTVNVGGICTATISSLNAESVGTLAFVVNLKGSAAEVPEMVELSVGLTNGSQARTGIVTLVAGEENYFVSAGLVGALVLTQETPVLDSPADLPRIEQPKQQQFLFLPVVQAQG